jgi:molybdopterin molybdotransferase
MLDLYSALDIVSSHAPSFGGEYSPITALSGRIAAESILSPEDFPKAPRSLMDGVAFSSLSDLSHPLILRGDLAAGEKTAKELAPGEAVLLSTGSYLPAGADSVVPTEWLSVDDGMVTVHSKPEPGKHIEPKAALFRKGDRVLAEGELIDARHVETLASLRLNNVNTMRLPRLGILSTGSEIIWRFASRSAKGLINSNYYGLAALLDRVKVPHSYMGVAKDRRGEIAKKLRGELGSVDAVVTFGGTAKGKYDLTEAVITGELGGEILVDQISASPGRTFRFAMVQNKPVFIFPGTPLAAMTCGELFLMTWLLKTTGVEWRKALNVCSTDFDIRKKEGFHKIIPAWCRISQGRLTASERTLTGQAARGAASGLVLAGAELGNIKAGAELPVFMPYGFF